MEQSNSLYLAVLKTLNDSHHGHNSTLNDIIATRAMLLLAFTTPAPTIYCTWLLIVWIYRLTRPFVLSKINLFSQVKSTLRQVVVQGSIPIFVVDVGPVYFPLISSPSASRVALLSTYPYQLQTRTHRPSFLSHNLIQHAKTKTMHGTRNTTRDLSHPLAPTHPRPLARSRGPAPAPPPVGARPRRRRER